MKKIALFLVVITFAMSCKKTTFSISGTVENNSLNGTTVFIKERINREWKIIDSTKIENQAFTFNGKADTVKIAYIAYEYTPKKRIRQAFVLENGKIVVSIDSVGFMKITGTTQNELLQTYQSNKNRIEKKSEDYYKLKKDSIKSPQQRAVFDIEMEKFAKEETESDLKFAIDHVNTLVGTHVFTNTFYSYNLKQKEMVINLMNTETKAIKRITEIIADMVTERKTAVGQQYIDIKMADATGKLVALSELVGKSDYVLIDFWASWCSPCMQFLPDLQAFYAKYKGSQLEIFGVSLDDDKNAWLGAISSHKIEWKLVSDLKGWKCEGSRAYAVNSIPATVLISEFN